MTTQAQTLGKWGRDNPDSIVHVDHYGALVGGAAATNTAAFAAAFAAVGTNGTVLMSEGQYPIVELVYDGSGGVTLQGQGMLSTSLLFSPTADFQEALTLKRTATANSVFWCVLKDFSIVTTNTSYDKTAIKILDGAETTLQNVAITGFHGSGKNAVGLRTYGRESFWADNLIIDANCPIVIDVNPTTTAAGQPGWLSGDHFTFNNIYLLNTSTNLPGAGLVSACVQVMDGAQISQLQFTGSQAWVGNRYGFYWVNASNVYTYNTSLLLDNIRTEGGLDPATYWSVYISLTSADPLRNFSMRNCEFQEQRNAVYTRNVWRQSWTAVCAMQASALKVFDIDSAAEGEISWDAVNTISTAGGAALTLGSAWSLASAQPHYDGYPYPSTAVWVREAVGATYNQRPRREMSAHTWHWAGTLVDDGLVNIPVNNANNWEHAIVEVSASFEYTPTSTAVGAVTAGTIYAIGIGTVNLDSAGTGTLNIGDIFTLEGDETHYTVTAGDANVGNGGPISFLPLLKAPAYEEAITVVTLGIQDVGAFKLAPVTQGSNGVKKLWGDMNVVAGNSDGDLCVYCAGATPMVAPVYVANRLGKTAYVTIAVTGKRSVET